jgi:hypothetical protein
LNEKKVPSELGEVLLVCNPSTWDSFPTSLGYKGETLSQEEKEKNCTRISLESENPKYWGKG